MDVFHIHKCPTPSPSLLKGFSTSRAPKNPLSILALKDVDPPIGQASRRIRADLLARSACAPGSPAFAPLQIERRVG